MLQSSRQQHTKGPQNPDDKSLFSSGPRPPGRSRRTSMGFTLLELVMVMTIMVTLAAVGVVNYQRVREKAKETLLKDDLKTMRKLIDQYSADKETLPDSLDDLVSASYLREVPIDPISGKSDWDLEMGDDPFSRTTKQGVVDIHSKAPGLDSEGRAFTDY